MSRDSFTGLTPHHLGQSADELRRRVDAQTHRFFVDDLAD